MPIAPYRPSWQRFLLTALCIVALAAGSSVTIPILVPDAHAQSDTSDEDSKKSSAKRAKKHFRQGQRLFAMGRFREALTSYEKAHSLSQYPDILFNMAQCYRNLGDFESAIFHFRLYLKQKPDAKNREAVVELMEKLDEEMAAADRERDKKARRKKRQKKPARQPITKKPEEPADRSNPRPIYGKWWFWFSVAAVAGASVGGYYILDNQDSGTPDTALGNIDFPPRP